MKKFFTLIAATMMVAGANAQGTYAVQEGDAISAGLKIESVPGVTMTFSETGGTFIAGKKVANWVDADFVAYSNGSANGKFSAGTAPTGCYYKFETSKDGVLTVGIQLSPNKGFFVADKDFASVELSSYNLPSSKDATESQTLTTNEKGEPIIPASGIKSNGTVTFNVAANGTYYVLATGTKLGFFGFKFTTTSTGINDINVAPVANENAPVYNLAGQRVSKEAKGILIQNGKKFINNNK